MVDYFDGLVDLESRLQRLSELLGKEAVLKRWAVSGSTGLLFTVVPKVGPPRSWRQSQIEVSTSFRDYLGQTKWDNLGREPSTGAAKREKTYSALVSFAKRELEPWSFLNWLLRLHEHHGEAVFGLPLNNVFTQIDFPMTFRLYTLPKLYQQIDLKEAPIDCERVLQSMKSQRVDCPELEVIRNRMMSLRDLAECKPSEFDGRKMFERVLEVCRPHGLKLADHMAFTGWCAWDIVWNELEETALRQELEQGSKIAISVLDGGQRPVSRLMQQMAAREQAQKNKP